MVLFILTATKPQARIPGRALEDHDETNNGALVLRLVMDSPMLALDPFVCNLAQRMIAFDIALWELSLQTLHDNSGTHSP